MCKIFTIFVCLVLSISTQVHAAAIGLPDAPVENVGDSEVVEDSKDVKNTEPAEEVIISVSTVRFGIGARVSHEYVNDDVNRTKNITSINIGSLYISNWLSAKKTRYLAELYMADYGFKADFTHIGEAVSQKGLRLSAQINRPMIAGFSPWFGVGMDVSYSSFTKRHSVDADGYRIKDYPNKKTVGLALLVNALEKWNINKHVAVAGKLEYSVPINQTVSGFSASIILLFRPPF